MNERKPEGEWLHSLSTIGRLDKSVGAPDLMNFGWDKGRD